MRSFPIRFVKIIRLKEHRFLFAGVGGDLRIYHIDQQYRLIFAERIFDTNYVYGIEQHGTSGKFCIYGQRLFRIVELEVRICEEKLQICCKKGSVISVGDWIWAVEWMSAETIALLLGHNQMLTWSLTSRQKEANVQCEECCLLYSGIFVRQRLEDSDRGEETDCAVFSGTIFNEILLWLPFDSTKVLHRLRGHQGVIFGVTYDCHTHSLCSVSDDRSCRVWRFLLSDQQQLSNDHPPSRDQWLQGHFEPLHVVYGHEARVWRSVFVDRNVVTVGEDGMVCLWDIETGRLCKKWKAQRGGIRAVEVEPSSNIPICGTDSSCIFSISLPSDFENEGETNSVSNSSLSVSKDSTEDVTAVYYMVQNELENLQSASSSRMPLVKESVIVTVTNCGNVKVIESNAKTTLVLSTPSLRYSTGSRFRNRLAVGGLDGRVHVLDFSEILKLSEFKPFSGKIFSVHFVGKDGQFLLVGGPNGILTIWNAFDIGTDSSPIRTFSLPAGKQRWLESAVLKSESNIDFLVVGDRNGCVYFYSMNIKDCEADPQEPTQLFPKIHGHKEVTDFCIDDQSILHSIGRDGCWRKWRYDQTGSKWKILCCEKLSHHFEWPSRFLQWKNQLLIAGFKSNKFVMYNSDSDQYLCEVECGGGHRSYDLRISEDRLRFLFTKKGQACETIQRLDWIEDLSPAVHLRRITDVVILSPCVQDDGSAMIGTASEDTSIGIWSVREESYHLQQRLKGHISSVHCLCASGRWLISGGGRSEICWWHYVDDTIGYRLTYRHKSTDDDVRCLGLQMVSRNSGNIDNIVAIFSDGRLSIFGTQVTPTSLLSRPAEVVRLQSSCCLTRLHALHFEGQSSSSDQPISTDHFPLIFAIGTDGKLYIVNKSLPSSASTKNAQDEVEESTSGSSSEEIDNDQQLSVYARPMKNRSRRRKLMRMRQENGPTKKDLDEFTIGILVERAGLTAMDAKWMDEGGALQAICCIGSESGAIHLLKFRFSIDFSQGWSVELIWKQRLSDWHSSTVSGITFLGNEYIVSNGIDQRVGVWKLQDVEAQEVSLVAELFSHVADPANLCMSVRNGGFYAAICGAGIEIVKIPVS